MELKECTRCIKITEKKARDGCNFFCQFHKKHINKIGKCEKVKDFQRPDCENCEMGMKLLAVKRTFAAYACECGNYKNIIFKKSQIKEAV